MARRKVIEVKSRVRLSDEVKKAKLARIKQGIVRGHTKQRACKLSGVTIQQFNVWNERFGDEVVTITTKQIVKSQDKSVLEILQNELLSADAKVAVLTNSFKDRVVL